MDVKDLVGQLRALVEGARSMPMSSSAVLNRGEVLDLVGRIEAALPTAFADQDRVYAERESLISQARDESQQMLKEAEAERDRLVGETEVYRVAKHEAARVEASAASEAEALRRETDDYIDTRLATFEISLTKTLEAVSRGRARLQGRSHLDSLGDEARRDYVEGLEDGEGSLTLRIPDELRTREPEPRD